MSCGSSNAMVFSLLISSLEFITSLALPDSPG